MQPGHIQSCFIFGEFTLDRRRRVLVRNHRPIHLRGKPFRLLEHFVIHPNIVIAKDQLLKDLWPESISEASLYSAVRTIRLALEDTNQDWLKNEPGEGYRFVADVYPCTAEIGIQEGIPGRELLEVIDNSYRVEQASEDEVRWAAGLARRVYHGIDVIPSSLMVDWYRTNPSGFSVIRSDAGPIGNLDLLPLRNSTLDQFIKGDVLEREIKGKGLFPPDEAPQISSVYVESFVCIISASADRLRPNAIAAARVLSTFSNLAARICDPRQLRNVFAIAASANGRQLLSRLGFKIISHAERRRDQHDLYAVGFTHLARTLVTYFGQGRLDPLMMELIAAENIEEGL
jgi:DNA-binding winged helix-turn-helix (wHTH) protein